MHPIRCVASTFGAFVASILFCVQAPVFAADAAAAQALARQSNCFKCHAVDKNKEATSWKELAGKLKSDKDAQAKLVNT